MKNLILIIAFSYIGYGIAQTDTINAISPKDINSLISAKEKIQLVDVRTPEEYNEGHLKNSENICITTEDFEANINSLDRNKAVYVYCRSGIRSTKAALKMKEFGFKEIYNMEGGILLWTAEGFPIVKE